jgi:hypothetical protein
MFFLGILWIHLGAFVLSIHFGGVFIARYEYFIGVVGNHLKA